VQQASACPACNSDQPNQRRMTKLGYQNSETPELTGTKFESDYSGKITHHAKIQSDSPEPVKCFSQKILFFLGSHPKIKRAEPIFTLFVCLIHRTHLSGQCTHLTWVITMIGKKFPFPHTFSCKIGELYNIYRILQ